MTCSLQIRLVGGRSDCASFTSRRGSPVWLNLLAHGEREAFSDKTALQRGVTQGWYMYVLVLEFKLLAELVQTGARHRFVREVVSVLLDERERSCQRCCNNA